jgi:cyclic pyranopterin phosphate synthase
MSGIVEVGDKQVVQRRATAAGRLRLRPDTLAAIRNGTVAKGNVAEVARTAAVLAVKRTPDLLPYCHPIPITGVDVAFETADEALEVRVTVTAEYKTGVEMEALTGVTVALLTAWDLVKPLEKDTGGQYPTTRLEDVHVVEKVKS